MANRAWLAIRAGALTSLLVVLASCSTAPPPRPRDTGDTACRAGPWPRAHVLELAKEAYECGEVEGRFSRPVLTVIDYSLPSSEPRLWVIDLEQNQVVHQCLVAHGEGSGLALPVAFSNEAGSHQSSLGLFRADEVYRGRFGYSLRLSGLEPGINDKARERAIVMHGLEEVSADFASRWGMIGRSWGCPALPVDAAPEVIDSIAGGSAIFAYYPDPHWLRDSRYLHCGVQFAETTKGN